MDHSSTKDTHSAIHSTRPLESTAEERALLRSRIERARIARVVLQPGQPARILSREELEQIMKDEELSSGSSAASSVTSDTLVTSSKMTAGRSGIDESQRGEEPAANDLITMDQSHLGSISRPNSPLSIIESASWVDEAEVSSVGFNRVSLPAASSKSQPEQSEEVKGSKPPELHHDAAASTHALESPSLSPLVELPRAPQCSPVTPGRLATLLVSSCPISPATVAMDVDDAGFPISVSVGLERHLSAHDGSGGSVHDQLSEQENEGLQIRTPLRIVIRGTSTGGAPQGESRSAASPESKRLPSCYPHRPAYSAPPQQTVPTSARSDTSGDSSLNLTFARRPTMTRQGSMGESFVRLYEDDKAAKRDKALRLMEMREKGGLAGVERARAARARSRASDTEASADGETRVAVRSIRSPRSLDHALGSPNMVPPFDEDSDVEIFDNAFEPSVFASPRSLSSLSSTGSKPRRRIYSVSNSNYHDISRSIDTGTSGDSISSMTSSPDARSHPTSPLFDSPPTPRPPLMSTSANATASCLYAVATPVIEYGFRPTFPRSRMSSTTTTPLASPTVSRRSSFSRARSNTATSSMARQRSSSPLAVRYNPPVPHRPSTASSLALSPGDHSAYTHLNSSLDLEYGETQGTVLTPDQVQQRVNSRRVASSDQDLCSQGTAPCSRVSSGNLERLNYQQQQEQLRSEAMEALGRTSDGRRKHGLIGNAVRKLFSMGATSTGMAGVGS